MSGPAPLQPLDGSRSEGYHKLASLMGAHPEVAIFRRFGFLNTLSLLYLQAELQNLEDRLTQTAMADNESTEGYRYLYNTDWQTLSESISAVNGNPEQWNTMQRIREKLNEYNQALLFQQEVAKIGSPSPQNLSFLQRWMMRPRMGNVYLLGPEGHIWENSQPSELLAIRPSISDNWFTRFSSTILVRWYHRIIGRFFRKPDSAAYHGNTVEYSQEGIGHLTVVIGTAVASLLPVASIIVLYFIVSMAIRLFFVALFTVLFSLGLSLLTNGRMVEIFSATSAFAAVLVVFVGSTGSTATP